MKQWQKPYTFPGGLTLQNRLVFAPISTMSSTEIGQLTKEEISFYKRRSQKAGMVILGSANISNSGKAYNQNVSIAHDAMIPNLKQFNKQIKQSGAKTIIQLYHGGAAIQFLPEKKNIYVVSKENVISLPGKSYYELTESNIHQILMDFGRAIQRAILAGFDGIEIHAGNPFLLQQFLSPRTNQRHDFWGGNEQKRFHFLEVVLKLAIAIKKETGNSDFVIGVRLAIEEKEPDGLTFFESSRIAARASLLGVDYLHFNQDDIFEDHAKRNRLQIVQQSIPDAVSIIGNGNVNSLETLEKALNIFPLVSVARSIILHPDFPEKYSSDIELKFPEGLKKSFEASPKWYLHRE